MESSPQKQKRKLQSAIIVAIVLVVAAIVIIVLIPRKASKSEIVAPKAKPAVSKEPIEWDRDSIMNAYRKEQERFANVLSEASDDELFVVLNFAIAHQYVPNRDVDPFHDMFVMVGH